MYHNLVWKGVLIGSNMRGVSPLFEPCKGCYYTGLSDTFAVGKPSSSGNTGNYILFVFVFYSASQNLWISVVQHFNMSMTWFCFQHTETKVVWFFFYSCTHPSHLSQSFSMIFQTDVAPCKHVQPLIGPDKQYPCRDLHCDATYFQIVNGGAFLWLPWTSFFSLLGRAPKAHTQKQWDHVFSFSVHCGSGWVTSNCCVTPQS